MAEPKKRRRTKGTGDTFRGRRGGGWLPEGYDPSAPKAPIERKPPTKSELEEEERKKRQTEEVALFERTRDLVPGTARYGANGPEGGVSWEGRARMARARIPDEWNDDDEEAIRRFPNPTGYVGEELR